MEALVSVSPGSFTNFGELLRFLRERVELSQKELALQVGYHYSYMSRIEKNQRIPDPTTLMARFVPALNLDAEPEWTARLLELAGGSESKISLSAAPVAEAKPALSNPPTALPIFDLSSSNLPTILTPLLGRDEEVVALTDLLTRSDVRLVTLIGPPGVGKTRLAAHIAAQLAGAFANGPLFVDLTDIFHADNFLPTLADVLGVREISDVPLIKSITASLRHRNLLLVLDNFEHVVNASPHIPPLLTWAPGLKILVTSREALHVSGEYEFPVLPLRLPGPFSDKSHLLLKNDDDLINVSHYASVQLFIQRARAVQPAFQLTDENAAAVVEICQHLDGLPLAIELAATRIKTLAPQAMLQQLDRRLDWLTRGARDANSWRQTLRGTMEWSYALLSEPECILLRRLAVFSGGWTLRTAEAVCADQDNGVGKMVLRREDVLDVLGKLIDKSLVIAEAGTHQGRYHLFETTREFAREKLLQAGELTDTLNRHLAHFAEYAEESENHLDGNEQVKWIFISEIEHNNIRAAIDYSLTDGAEITNGLRIGAAISLFWIERNHFREGIERLQSLLKHALTAGHQPARAKMLYRAAAIYTRTFDYNIAYNLCQQSVEISRAIDEKRSLASALFYLGDICIAIRDYLQAKAALEESVSICWSIHFPQQLNMALTSLGRLQHEQGEHDRAIVTTGEALAIAEQVDDTWGIIHALQLLGAINRFIKAYDIAIDYFERSLPAIRLIGDRLAEGVTLANLSILYNLKENYSSSGHAAEQSFVAFQSIGDEIEQPFPLRMMGYSSIHTGNIVRARALIIESLRGNRGQGHIPGQLACLIALGTCALEEGNAVRAVTLATLVESHLQAESYSLMEPDAVALNHLLTVGKEKLGRETFEQTLVQTRSLHMDDIVAQELPSAA
jgi:predicted ATPase/transcriptional regulator with XRE-family HTH domain